ncbi:MULTISPECIES: DUF6116 family protein [unclassified Luteimonas]|uniref:DUF6116 family protein n=1 Tax=unclassified Luteimonas TaxID=2629088 RepID=UPI0018F0ECF5|nr:MULTISPECIES: DUF6116 family protein [unclassified Luteimonas]MBJ6982960.1 hypothetical protein [Luteimonas sp. MC1572]MBJ7574436.1 hypothetical protein [Luteimonas sp. MC1828]QQO04179.1 hypothetical protein JGR64_05360 [Luteimonas sp. MC1572]
MPNPLLIPLMRWLGRLSFPKLFMAAAGLFLVTLVVPDPLPFVDEILFGLGALLLARRKRPAGGTAKDTIDGEARRG